MEFEDFGQHISRRFDEELDRVGCTVAGKLGVLAEGRR
jgi:hypothetical protein